MLLKKLGAKQQGKPTKPVSALEEWTKAPKPPGQVRGAPPPKRSKAEPQRGSRTQVTFDSLPNELLVEIASHLDSWAAISLRKCSARLRTLLALPVLLANIQIANMAQSQTVYKVLSKDERNLAFVKSFTLRMSSSALHRPYKLGSFTNLQSLELSQVKFDLDGPPLPSLRSLRIVPRPAWSTPMKEAYFRKLIESLPNLTRLELHNCLLKASHLAHITHCKRLQSLTVVQKEPLILDSLFDSAPESLHDLHLSLPFDLDFGRLCELLASPKRRWTGLWLRIATHADLTEKETIRSWQEALKHSLETVGQLNLPTVSFAEGTSLRLIETFHRSYIDAILSSAKRLERLELRGVSLHTEAKFLRRLSTTTGAELRHLTLVDCSFDDFDMDFTFPSLIELQLHSVTSISESVYENIHTRFPRIAVLEWSQLSFESRSQKQGLLKDLAKCQRLRVLRFINVGDPQQLLPVINTIGKNLEELVIWEPIGVDLPLLNQISVKCASLISLELRVGSRVPIESITSVRRGCPKLQHYTVAFEGKLPHPHILRHLSDHKIDLSDKYSVSNET